MNARADRFPLFDSLRAIAALSVLGFHVAFFQLLIHDSPLTPYMSHLDVGVTIFFLISGFLLYRPFVAARIRNEPPPHAPAYAWRRFLRITPAYWVALTVVALWLGLDEVLHRPLVYYGFAQIYDPVDARGGIGQAWTLCVEVTFYALLPLWALAMRRLGGRAEPRRVVRQELVALVLLWLLSLGYKAWALAQAGPDDLNNAPYLQPLPNFLDQFAIGMALAVLTVHWERAKRLPRAVEALRRHDWIPWLVAAVAFWAVSTQLGFTGRLFHDTTTRRMFIGRHELYSLVALAVLVPAILATPGRGLAGRILGSRVLSYLGLVSFGIYLYHFAVINRLDRWIGDSAGGTPEVRALVHGVLAVAFATALASASYYAVERPALRLKRLVRAPERVERGEATSEPAPAEPSGVSGGA
jgi:peptidoglycan/LPS O-acetylase OafA/YrhL